jgi:diacylglycerol kinase family enzyme
MASPTLESLERLADAGALTGATPRKRMLVIVNPYASTVSDRLKSLVVYALRGRYDVHAVDTQRRQHATQLCREAAQEGYDLVVAFGGDGTVNEAANGLVGSDTALSVLPGGRTNVYCRVLGIPPEIVDATEHLLGLADDWNPRRVDLGRVNGRCFTFTAGLGLDASVVERVDSHPALKARMGAYYFTYAAVTTFTRRYLVAPPRIEVEVEGERFKGVTAIVQNLEPYTYFYDRPIEVAEGVAPQDGTLAGAVLERASPIDMPTVAWRAFSRRARILRHRRVHGFAGVTELSARSLDDRPVPLQVDGDHVDDVLEATYDVLPRALLVVA